MNPSILRFVRCAMAAASLLALAPATAADGPAVAGRAVAAVTAPAARAPSLAEPADDRSARGVVRALGEATLASRLAGRIVAMPVQEGEAFARGALLVQFDCERQRAEARAAVAAVSVQKHAVETQVELERHNATGRNELASARSQLEKVQAEADALQLQLRDCAIHAPFAGRVVERLARAHEAVAPSQPLLRVADTSQLELDLIVPSHWLVWLQPGAPFEFRVDETAQTHGARVQRLGAAVDPVSKTVKITARFAGAAPRVLPGMSGAARFALPAGAGAAAQAAAR